MIALLLLGGVAGAQSSLAPADESPWYLDRGPRSDPGTLDDVPTVAAELGALMRDGGVPGFYDGQFDALTGSFEDLARLASDPDVHTTMRMMAVMALQEASDDPELLTAILEPLIIPAEFEFEIEKDAYSNNFSYTPPGDEVIREELRASLSRHARFALAKAGRRLDEPAMTALILEKIGIMEEHLKFMRQRVLRADHRLSRRPNDDVEFAKVTWFNIGYHYQQFDDYKNAARWFSDLCDSLPAGRDTRWARYNLACMSALSGDPTEAVAHLRRAYGAGFTDVSWMQEDGDLDSLRGREDFEALIQLMLSGEGTSPLDGSEAERSGTGETP
jgi:hypothetical protein